MTLGSTVVKAWPREYFRVERNGARMPVWVRGNAASGVFVVFNHGGPGSSGTLESILEVSPADGRFGRPSPFQVLELDYAMVYWDQRHSGMSGGPAEPNDSRPDDFGEDLALVVREVRKRYEVRHLFLVGQSWGHAVAMSYLTRVPGWRENQPGTSGYVVYKGNHEQELPYRIGKEKIVAYATRQVAAGRDAAYWEGALAFYSRAVALRSAADAAVHQEYAARAMGVSIGTRDRIWSSFRASVFTPFNGWKYFLNNRRTMRAERFLSWVLTSTEMRDGVPRLAVPTLLVYGANDLVAPPEVGRALFAAIATPPSRKSLVILPHSRHGAEGSDVPLLQESVRDFIRRHAL